MEQVNPPSVPEQPPVQPPRSLFGGRELLFAVVILLCGMIYCNFVLYGGFNLGYAIGTVLCILCCAGYLLLAGCRPTLYSGTILALCVVIAAAFGRSDDGFVKFVMTIFLFMGTNLGLCLLAGQNIRNPGEARSLLDAPGVFFRLGCGKVMDAFRALKQYLLGSGTAGRNIGAVLLGLGIALPVLVIVIPLLVRADAAFDGLLQLLPKFDVAELFATVLYGLMAGWIFFSLGVSLRHAPKRTVYRAAAKKGLNVLTVNTVQGAVCFVYAVYLISQLAYFVGGFAGILPEEYTMAQYARRGFFEMAWLCAINLGIIALSMRLSGKKNPVPLSTRLLCLFIGIVTIFLVATASGKMFLYIGSYGLTRLRVLTQTVMLFLALTTVLVCVWLFVPKLPYMKTVVIAALVIGSAVIWADVDTQVANYNVSAYLSGDMKTVDVHYLNTLGDGAVPHIARLAEHAPDPQTAQAARNCLTGRFTKTGGDFRGWNYVNYIAGKYAKTPAPEADLLPEDTSLSLEHMYHAQLYGASFDTFCVGDGYLCLRGWQGNSDKRIYCLALPNGDMYEPVYAEASLLQLCADKGLDTAAFGNWISLPESEYHSGEHYVGLRGRSIEEDAQLWYILDTQSNTTHGPYRGEDDYWQACCELKFYPLIVWEPASQQITAH